MSSKNKNDLFKEVTDDQAAVTLIRKGLSSNKVDLFIRFSGLTQKDILEATRLRTSTFYSRLKSRSAFKEEEANKLVRLMRIYQLAEKTLGDADHALEWLKTENPALGGEIPLHLLDTDPGAREVESLLLRIEYGIYS
jgi:putative toxin-antitoxin system antitoxin component (TIGR02293 family)